MEYQYLDTDQRKAMLEARLRQLENEHYGHALNKTNSKDDDAITAADEAMATIDAAYEAAQTELSALNTSKEKK